MTGFATKSTGDTADTKGSAKMIGIPEDDLLQMAETLQKNNGLLGLSPTTLQLLDPFLDLPLLELLASEFEHHLDQYISPDSRYNPDDSSYFKAPIKDLQTIRELPGGTVQALQLLPLTCQRELSSNVEIGAHQWYEWSMEDSTNIDEASYSMLQELLKGKGGPIQDLDMDTLFGEMNEQRTRWRGREQKEMEEVEDDLRDIIDRDSLPVFEKSLKLLRAWHAREVGAMLSMKVAGHLLPPELVENIAENFNDKEVLKVLEN